MQVILKTLFFSDLIQLLKRNKMLPESVVDKIQANVNKPCFSKSLSPGETWKSKSMVTQNLSFSHFLIFQKNEAALVSLLIVLRLSPLKLLLMLLILDRTVKRDSPFMLIHFFYRQFTVVVVSFCCCCCLKKLRSFNLLRKFGEIS